MFVLEFCVRDQGAYQQIRENFFKMQGLQSTPYLYLDCFPQKEHSYNNGYIEHSRIMSKGGFGVVTAGIDVRDGSPVAIKTVPTYGHSLSSVLIELQQEHAVNSRLASANHPNIVEVVRMWCRHNHDGPCFQNIYDHYYIAMPLGLMDLGISTPHVLLQPRYHDQAKYEKSRQRRAYPQQIVTTRLLYCLQDPFAQLSRLQRI